jgi:trk system potassium uptake protein TrkA
VEIPHGAMVGAVVRGDKTIIPQSDTVIEPGDHVVVVCLPSAVPAVEKLFE